MIHSIYRFFNDRIWSAIPGTVTPQQRRIAAMVWPAALALIGLLIAWRRHRDGAAWGMAPWILWALAPTIGAGLLAGGGAGRLVYLGIMRTFATFGFFLSHLVLILFFYLFVTPLGWLLKLMGKDLLQTRIGTPPAWTAHAATPEPRRFYRLF